MGASFKALWPDSDERRDSVCTSPMKYGPTSLIMKRTTFHLSLPKASAHTGRSQLDGSWQPVRCARSRSAWRICDGAPVLTDRKSTRLNSSHSQISYAVFCLKKKKNKQPHVTHRIRGGTRGRAVQRPGTIRASLT